MILFCAWAAVSLIWSPSSDYGVRKAIFLGVFGFWSYFCGLVFVGRERERIRRFCWIVALLSIWVTIEISVLIFSGEILRELDWGSQYLGQGRLIGLGVLSLVGILFWGRHGAASKAGLTLLIMTLLIALLVLGGRGPFLATIAAMGVAFYRGTRLGAEGFFIRKNILISLSAILGVAIWFYFSGNMLFNTTTLDRLWMLQSVGGEGSVNTRFWFFGQAWDNWHTAPIIGHGIGSFGFLLGWRDVQVYPHNIILEILVELGSVGLVLFVALLYLSTRRLEMRFVHTDPYVALVAMLLINTFLNSLVTSDLSGNRVLYAALGLAAGFTQGARRMGNDGLLSEIGKK
jgi:O-antigen ligase